MWGYFLMSWHELGTDSHLTGGITPYSRVIVTHAERGRGGTSPPTSSTWSHHRSPTGELHSAALSGCLRAQSEENIVAKKINLSRSQTCKKKHNAIKHNVPAHSRWLKTSTFTDTCSLWVAGEEQSPFILPLPRHVSRKICWPCPVFMQRCLIL